MNKRFITHGLAVIGIAAFAFLSIASGASTPSEKAYRNATNYVGAKDYDKAIEALGEAIRLDPTYKDAYRRRANLLVRVGMDYDQAIADIDKYFELHGREDDNYTYFANRDRGKAYQGKGEYDKAIADFETALRKNPPSTELGNSHPVIVALREALAEARQMAASQGTSSSVAQNGGQDTPAQILAQANTGTGSAQSATANVPGTVTWNGKEVTWIEAVNGIRSGGNDKKHTITVSGIVSIPITPASETTFGGVTGLKLFIEGSGTLTRSGGSNGSLLRIGAEQEVQVKDCTLQCDNIALKGRNAFFAIAGNAAIRGDDDSAIAVSISSSGAFVMSGSATISGYDSSAVHIEADGGFLMEGGTISGNGLGVYVDGGVFLMQGGTISGNDGGVSVYNHRIINRSTFSKLAADEGVVYRVSDKQHIVPSLFIMNGGTISGNSGGVNVESAGQFIMKNGTIAGNTVEGDGGGVNVGGQDMLVTIGGTGGIDSFIDGKVIIFPAKFIMKGGTISGNRAQGNGGGVYATGRFVMEGGTVAGNIARNGSGVFASSGDDDFTKTGGTIYGNNEPDVRLRNTASNRQGHAMVTRDNWRNATAGPDMNTDSYGFWLNETN